MKRAELGLLEVLGLVVNAGGGMCRGELRILLFFIFGAMKRAELGLLEVLGLLVRMPGEGDVTALPCFVGS
jgi:hypothetical protein